MLNFIEIHQEIFELTCMNTDRPKHNQLSDSIVYYSLLLAILNTINLRNMTLCVITWDGADEDFVT